MIGFLLFQTFRDTDACREMVIDYTCLWWGSANEMYDNRCGIEAQVFDKLACAFGSRSFPT